MKFLFIHWNMNSRRAWNFASFVYCCLSNALTVGNVQQIPWINRRNLFESIIPAYELSHTSFSVSTRTQLSPWHQLCSPFPSTQPIGEGLSLLTTRGCLFHPELPFWPALILKNPVKETKGWDEATEIPVNISEHKSAGDSHGKTIPLPASALDHKAWNGRIHRFHPGLKFWYFSRFSLFLKNSIITAFLVNTPVKFPLPEGVIVPPLPNGWSCRWLLSDPDHCKLFCYLCLRRKRQGQGTDFTRLSQTSWNIFQHWELGKIPSMFGLGPYFFLIAEPKGNMESIYSRVIFPTLIQIFLGESYLVTLSLKT